MAKIADDIGIMFAAGIFILLALGILIWGIMRIRDNGVAVSSLIAVTAAEALFLVAFGFFLSGVAIGF